MSYNVSESTFKVGTSVPYVQGGTDVSVADGGTGSSTAAGARTNLGLVIGTDVQAYDAELAALAGLASAPDALPYFTGSGTAAVTTMTAAARALLDDADATGQRATLGLGSIATQAASSVNITGGTINGATIIGLPSPTNAGDAATKGYADAIKQGLFYKDATKAATISALPANTRSGNVLTASANGAIGSIDGVGVGINDRILVKNEATGANNGIYFVSAVGDVSNPWTLTRVSDADADADVKSGMYAFVSEGTTNADSSWVLTTNDPITLNTTALSFTQFSGAGQITAGNGLTKTGNTIDVVPGFGLQVAADNVQVQLDGTTLAVGAPGLKVNTGGINTNELANLSVSTAKIQAQAVTSNELGNNAVTAGKIANAGISANNQFAAGVVDTNALANDSVDAAKLKDDASVDSNRAVTTNHIRDGAITTPKIAAGAVGNTELANLSVSQAKIQASAVGSGEIADNAVVNSKLANNAVNPAKADLSQAWAFTGVLSANGGLKVKQTITATNYTTVASDVYVGVSDTAAPRTITLVAAATAGAGATLIVKDQSGGAGTNNITIDGNASENIDGATTKIINTNYGSVTLVCDGVAWFVI